MIDKLVVLFFMLFIYSVIGWTMEVIAVGIGTKQWVNRGFLIGPYCPIYGCGCVLMILLLGKYKSDPIVLFVLAAVICSLLEYMTSFLMEKLFKARWWDYSKKKFNINGRVCLTNTLAFGILGTLMVYFIDPMVTSLVAKIPQNTLYVVTSVLAVIMLTDVCVSFNVISKVKKFAFEAKKDNTYEITTRVKEMLLAKGFLGSRLMNAYPNLVSTIKSKKQELDEKRVEFISKVKENVNEKKLKLEQEIVRFKVKDEDVKEDGKENIAEDIKQVKKEE